MISGADQSFFVREFTRGVSYKLLSLHFNRAPATMRRWRKTFGLPPRHRQGYPSQHKIYVGFYLDKKTAETLIKASMRAGLTKSELLRRLVQRRFQGVEL